MRRAVAQRVDAHLPTRFLAPLTDEHLPYFEHGSAPATDAEEAVTLAVMSGKQLYAKGAYTLESLIEAKMEIKVHETTGQVLTPVSALSSSPCQSTPTSRAH